MGDIVFNIAKGHVAEYHDRVANNDPANSALIVMLGFGTITDAVLRDLDDFAAIIADANFTEATFTNYARKVLTDADVTASAPDDTNDRVDIDIPDQTWTSAGGATNNTLTRLVIGYDADTTAGTDANIVPLCAYDFAVTTDGTDLIAQVNASGYFRAS